MGTNLGQYIHRFRAVNPGWWFAHCHLELHLMGGTGYAYKVGNDNEIYMPPDNFPKDCGTFKVDKLPELRLPIQNVSMARGVLFIFAAIFWLSQ
uniref:Plastocyanin-like domain-containing protein n=1 Tax=Caenorhabditis japonica TaxID=281687 RepID=A0A8R1IPM4_CAEJA